MRQSYKDIAKEVLETESSALLAAINRLDEKELSSIIELIYRSQGKLVVCGVGKSGLIGQKISATLSSTGTPSVFLHPTEAMHGDLGLLQKDDVILAISYSGKSEELTAILPHIRRLGNPIITMSRDRSSPLSSLGDYFLDISIEREACPLNIAPTSSTTLTLALGDVLAVCLMKRREFRAEDFASFHPGGALGKQLFVKLSDLMQREDLPLIAPDMPLSQAIIVMSQKRLGSAILVENGASEGKLVGVLSDGDLRRAMMSEGFSLEAPVSQYATPNPKTCNNPQILAYDALRLMEEQKIQLLLVTNEAHRVLGAVHLHTLISAGL